MRFASTLPEAAQLSGRFDRFTLSFITIGLALVGLVAYIVLDLHNAQEEAQQICEQSVDGLDLVGEMQYQIQEARRSMLYALATTDPNQQVRYADQSRDSATEVARLFGSSHEMPLPSRLRPSVRDLENEWTQYLTNRDEVIAAILEGEPQRGVQLDLVTGVPAFNRVREDLQRLRRHFNEEARNRLAEVNHLFTVSLWKFALSLCLTVLFATVAVKLVQRDKMLAVVKASENRLDELIRSINEGMMVINCNGAIELWNQAAARSTGLWADRVLGQPLGGVFPPAACVAIDRCIHHCTSTGLSSTVTGLSLLGQGSKRVFEARVFPFEHGTMVLFNDVTETAYALTELKAAREQAEGLARSGNELIQSLAGAIETAVEHFDSMHAVSDPKTTGRNQGTLDYCNGSSSTSEILKALRQQAQQARGGLSSDRHGQQSPSTGVAPAVARESIPVAASSDDALLQSQKVLEDVAHLTRVAATGELAASIAHELNQPLTAILANSQATRRILSREPADLHEVRAALEDIISDSQRAGEVIRRLRMLFKRSRLERQLLDINELVWDTVHLLKTEMQLHDVVTRMDLSAGLAQVTGDRVQLQQVILNLMINAIDALSAVAPPGRLIQVASAAEGEGRVRVSIRDNGPGVDKMVMEQLFTPFFTTKKNGMGMGLSVARSIVEGHGGKLWVTNNPAGGAAFHFLLLVEVTSPGT